MFRARDLHAGRSRWSGALLAAAFALGLLLGGIVGALTSPRRQAPAAAAGPPLQRVQLVSSPGYPAAVLRVIDGDTFEARVRVWPGLAVTTKVRLRGIDAPELRARCPEERMKAEAARTALGAMLAAGAVGISAVALDKYGGRVVADASARRTPDVAQAMLKAGVARRYAGGRRGSWCNEAGRR